MKGVFIKALSLTLLLSGVSSSFAAETPVAEQAMQAVFSAPVVPAPAAPLADVADLAKTMVRPDSTVLPAVAAPVITEAAKTVAPEVAKAAHKAAVKAAVETAKAAQKAAKELAKAAKSAVPAAKEAAQKLAKDAAEKATALAKTAKELAGPSWISTKWNATRTFVTTNASKAGAWIKGHKAVSAAIATGVVAAGVGTYMIVKAVRKNRATKNPKQTSANVTESSKSLREMQQMVAGSNFATVNPGAFAQFVVRDAKGKTTLNITAINALNAFLFPAEFRAGFYMNQGKKVSLRGINDQLLLTWSDLLVDHIAILEQQVALRNSKSAMGLSVTGLNKVIAEQLAKFAVAIEQCSTVLVKSQAKVQEARMKEASSTAKPEAAKAANKDKEVTKAKDPSTTAANATVKGKKAKAPKSEVAPKAEAAQEAPQGRMAKMGNFVKKNWGTAAVATTFAGIGAGIMKFAKK